MAGMLPGVECARRRRSGGWSDTQTTRRSSFCLYATKIETQHLNTTPSVPQRSTAYQAHQDEKLGGVAREAKERLDERLKSQKKSDPLLLTWGNFSLFWTPKSSFLPITLFSFGREKDVKGGKSQGAELGEIQAEVFGLKKKKGGGETKRRFNWVKVMMGWKQSEQEECAVCLERFESGETLVHLPCAHRFHSRCLVPWLETHAHCPCCRFQILSHEITH